MMNVLHSDPSTGRMPMPASVERLLNGSNKLLFASSDLDEVRSMVGRVMKPHRLDLTGQGERLDARMHYTSLGDLSVSRLRYGSAVQIEPGSLDSFFLVQMPLYGMARIESGAQHIDSSAELDSVLSPQEATRMTWMAGTDQLMLRLSRSLVERTLVGYLGHPLNEPLRFELGFRWRECAPWQCMLSYLIDCTLQHHDLAMHKIVVSQIEQLAASILVTSHRHNHCEDAPARRSTILPRHVRRAQDFLEAHAHEPVTAEQLAQAAGVSVRSLYAGFKDFLGVSPMQYLRDLRMERARAELMSGDSNHVAGVALRWGFAHMGRFSNEYKQRYGESPSKTLRAR
ncbi:AraC family transcriptional regulator [Herbaspirillum huttiense]|uniref:AraC family transcriptional regulator n=1 Tax=Herbaspirillum huttiense TaxID=863372 RepID=UPI003F3FAF5B